MAANKTRGTLNFRSLTTFTILLSFLVIAFTGVILYITPQGRVAHWTDWRLLGLGKEGWSAVHINTCLLFLIVAGFHVYLNWRVLFSYIRTRAVAGFRRKWELAIAASVTTVFVIGTLGAVPPFSTIIQWNEDIKDYWSDQVRTRPPFPHAEAMPLKAIADATEGMMGEDAVKALQLRGFNVADASVRLEDLAAENGVSPMTVYEAMIAGNAVRPSAPGRRRRP